MAQILIIYTTLRGKTGTMVEPVAEGMRAEGVEARIMQVEQVTMADMTAADGIVVGSRAVEVAEEGPAALRRYVATLRTALDS